MIKAASMECPRCGALPGERCSYGVYPRTPGRPFHAERYRGGADNHYVSPKTLILLAADLKVALKRCGYLRFGSAYGQVSAVGQGHINTLYDKVSSALERLPESLR